MVTKRDFFPRGYFTEQDASDGSEEWRLDMAQFRRHLLQARNDMARDRSRQMNRPKRKWSEYRDTEGDENERLQVDFGADGTRNVRRKGSVRGRARKAYRSSEEA